MLPIALKAGLWGLLSGSALIIGALFGYFLKIPQRLVAGTMAFGSGVLISALSFDLMDEAYKSGGFDSTAIGYVTGALIYTIANILVSRAGAKHRKRSKLFSTLAMHKFFSLHLTSILKKMIAFF